MSSEAKKDEIQKREQFKALICKCKETSAGEWQWLVDMSKLATVVTAEGLPFVDASGFCFPALDSSECDSAKAIVVFLHKSHSQVRVSRKFTSNALGYLVWGHVVRGSISTDPKNWFPINASTSQWEVAKWLCDDEDVNYCVVCYKNKTEDNSMEDRSVICICGTVVCFGCLIDMLLIADTEMTVECPNCRCEMDKSTNLFMLIGITFDRLKSAKALGEISEEHLAFIEKMTAIDLRLPRKRALEQAKNVCMFHDTVMTKVKADIDASTFFISTKRHMEVYREVHQYIDKKRKKKVVSGSADSRGVVARRGCANCGKQFWDKSDWRRAPKCTKCQRTAYCNAKCRKKHAKTHTTECSGAKGAKKKRKKKAKKKPKKGGCAYH